MSGLSAGEAEMLRAFSMAAFPRELPTDDDDDDDDGGGGGDDDFEGNANVYVRGTEENDSYTGVGDPHRPGRALSPVSPGGGDPAAAAAGRPLIPLHAGWAAGSPHTESASHHHSDSDGFDDDGSEVGDFGDFDLAGMHPMSISTMSAGITGVSVVFPDAPYDRCFLFFPERV